MTVEMVKGDIPATWYDAAIAARIVGMDIETSGLSLQTDRIATVQLYVPNMGTIMVRDFANPDYLVALLESPHATKIFHHAPFDLGFLVRDFNIWPDRIADTKVAAKILDPKRQKYIHPQTSKGSHSLQSLVWYYFEFMMDKTLAVSNWFEPELSPAQVEYAAKDVEYLPELLRKIELELSEAGLLHLARKAMAHIPTEVILQAKNYKDVYSY